MWQDYFGKELNSAYCIIGAPLVEYERILMYIKNMYSEYTLESYIFEIMKIEDAHVLRQKNTEKGKTILVFNIHFATQETQNALLKFIEEPPTGTHIILYVPHRNTLLDTLYSRCIVVDLRSSDIEYSALLPRAEVFLTVSYEERMALIKKLTKKVGTENDKDGNYEEEEEEEKYEKGESDNNSVDQDNKKDKKVLSRTDVQNFITELELFLSSYYKSNNAQKKFVEDTVLQLETLEKMKKYLLSSSASLPMILEMIALDLPVHNLYNQKIDLNR